MTNETLSSKIEKIISRNLHNGYLVSITFLREEIIDFFDKRNREAIQKLKEIKGKDKIYIYREDLVKEIDNIFGPALVHSQSKNEKDIISQSRVASRTDDVNSGTHGSDKICEWCEKEIRNDKWMIVYAGIVFCSKKCQKNYDKANPTTNNPKGCGKLLGATIKCGDGKEDNALILCKDCRPKDWGCDNQNLYKCGKCHTEQNMELRRHGRKQTSLYCPNCDDLIEPSICKKTTNNPKGCGRRMSGIYRGGGYWEMDCGDLGRLCPICSDKEDKS